MESQTLISELKELVEMTKAYLFIQDKDQSFLCSNEETLKNFPKPKSPTTPLFSQQQKPIPQPSPTAPTPPKQQEKILPQPQVIKEEKPTPPPQTTTPPEKTPEKPKPISSPIATLKREKPLVHQSVSHNYQSLIEKIAPEIKTHLSPPSDKEAKQIARNWKFKKTAAPITIITHHESALEKKLLFNLAKAIDAHFDACRLVDVKEIEKDNLWPNFLQTDCLSLLIAQDTTIWNLSHLKKLYQSVPTKAEHFIDKTPLFLMPSLSLYLKQPGLKKSLWHAICKKIQSIAKEKADE